ncbi:hypothetical protein ACTNDY_09650 [Tissierellaceae bacterium HCP3S3_D8]
MSTNLGYVRKFIILKKEFSNMKSVSPKGHGRLELRGDKVNISINVENAEKNNYYDVILVKSNDSFTLGRVYTDDNYNGKVDFNLNHRDLVEMGFPVNKINGILIMRDSHILLGGYFNRDDKSISGYIQDVSKKTFTTRDDSVEDIKIETETAKDVPIEPVEKSEPVGESELVEESESAEKLELVEEEKVSVEEENEREEAESEPEPELKPEQEPEVESVEEIEKVGEPIELSEQIQSIDVKQDPIVHGIHTEEEYDKIMFELFHEPEEYKESIEVEEVYIPPNAGTLEDVGLEGYHVDLKEQRKLNQKNQTTNYVLNILSFFPYIEPFKINLKGYNWWKIDIQEPHIDNGFLPYFSYIVGGNHKYSIIRNNITANDLMVRYGHYLFGLYNVNDEVKFYIYGIPGEFTIEEHPEMGTTGFNTWFESSNGVGYWLLYIDPTNGRIIYPINPMIPMK